MQSHPFCVTINTMADELLDAGRKAHAEHAWTDAYEGLTRADAELPLSPKDLELLAAAAYMVGLDDEQIAALERAHRAYVRTAAPLRAVRCAFWIGVHLILRGDAARGTGWFGRAQRLLDGESRDCVERGYLLATTAWRHLLAGEWEAAEAACANVVMIADRFDDPDLLALGLMDHGRALIWLGRVDDGLGKLDEAMVIATGAELSPIVTGLVYCGVIDGCHEAHELGRAHEWTVALSDWCARQPDLVPFTGTCLVHRAELLQVGGEWNEALEEARRAGHRFKLRHNRTAIGQASYRRGELLRLQGDLTGAESAYRSASRFGSEPQPGLALLRLRQGRIDAARSAMSRLAGTTAAWVERARLLPAFVEVMLAAGDYEAARSACNELEEIARLHGRAMLRASAAQARGALNLAEDAPNDALPTLRAALQLWLELEAPYDAARVRVLIAHACRAVGDAETAALELDAASTTFTALGASLDVAAVDALIAESPSGDAHGLSRRELEVLRFVASGAANKAIAAELGVSKRTVDRHVANILTKLRVPTRTAATAYAYQHELI